MLLEEIGVISGVDDVLEEVVSELPQALWALLVAINDHCECLFEHLVNIAEAIEHQDGS